MKLCLIDLSGVFRMHWHAGEQDEVNEAMRKTLNSVRSYVADYDHTAVCIDLPPYKRQEVDPQYKAHREKAPAVMHEQLARTIETLREEYHVFGAKGYEADDIIATICHWAGVQGHHVTIYTSDKDLMQLVCPMVEIISTATRDKYHEEAVKERFGVWPPLVHDLLALTGDKSDNVPGIKGVGPKTAAKWLNAHGGLEGVLLNADKLGDRWGPIVADCNEQIGKAWLLTQLFTNAPIKPEEILLPVERKEKPEPKQYDLEPEYSPSARLRKAASMVVPIEPEVIGDPNPVINVGTGPISGELLGQTPAHFVGASEPDADIQPARERAGASSPEAPAQSLERYTPTSWDKSLEPRDPVQAWKLARLLFESRMFGQFTNPESILAIVMTGRAFGMDAVASLRGFHMIKGKVSPSSQLLIGLVKRHPACEWFRLVDGDDKQAMWETKRKGEPEPTTMVYTLEDARMAGLAGLDQWKKRPKTMLRWRCGVELARVVYPDVTSGLYSVEEMEEI
jgi:5'-3' exonuclease